MRLEPYVLIRLKEWHDADDALSKAKRRGASEEKIHELEKRKERAQRKVEQLRGPIGGPRLEAYYLHYIKGDSLVKTARKVGYSDRGLEGLLSAIRIELGLKKRGEKHSKPQKKGAKHGKE